MTKDPAETMRIFMAVRAAIQAYQQQHNASPHAAFGLFGDGPMECAFMLSNPARTAEISKALHEKLGMLKAKGLDLSGIASAPQTVLA